MNRIAYFFKDAAAELRRDLPPEATIWAPIYDPTDDTEMERIHMIASTMDAFMRTENEGFANTHFVFTNDPESEDVTWERTVDGYAIHLCAESGHHWSQVIYQMGYAMMHCLIDHFCPDEKKMVRWAEELISETNALQMLYLFAENWEDTPLYPLDNDYRACIFEELEYYLHTEGTSALTRCRDKEELKTLSLNNEFDDRINETHDLYQYWGEGDIFALAHVRDFSADPLCLYTYMWAKKYPNSRAVEYVCRLHDEIPGCRLPVGMSIVFNMRENKPTEEQKQAIFSLIRCSPFRQYEYMIFEFMNSDRQDGEQIGIVFYQLYRDEDNSMHVELRIDTRRKRTMYSKSCDDEVYIRILQEIIEEKKIPDLSEWENITDRVFMKPCIVHVKPQNNDSTL